MIVTAGGSPNKLGVPGEEAYNARGVSYCAVCDGPFFNGKVLGVVGGRRPPWRRPGTSPSTPARST